MRSPGVSKAAMRRPRRPEAATVGTQRGKIVESATSEDAKGLLGRCTLRILAPLGAHSGRLKSPGAARRVRTNGGVDAESDSTREPNYHLFPWMRCGVLRYTVLNIYYYIIKV